MPVLNDADDIHLGSTQVDKVYLGATQVWPAPPVGGGTPVLFVVEDDTSLNAKEQAVRDILTAEGYTVTDRSWSAAEETSGYDLVVVGPIAVGIEPAKYSGANMPVFSFGYVYWGSNSGVASANSKGPLLDYDDVDYESNARIVWTGQSLGLVQHSTDNAGTQRYYDTSSWTSGREPDFVIGNRQFGSVRTNVFAYEVGDTIEDGSTASHRIVWCGWEDHLDNLTAAGEQFIADAAAWAIA